MAATASTKRSIDLVRRFNEKVFNGRDYRIADDLYAADYVQHGPMAGMELHGTDEAMELTRQFHAAFSDLESTEEFAFSDGEYVCTRLTYRGTHDGDLMGIPATNERGEVSGVVVNRIEDGKIAEAWITVDFLGLFQQLGVVPEMEDLAV